jgi:hypothetical protein
MLAILVESRVELFVFWRLLLVPAAFVSGHDVSGQRRDCGCPDDATWLQQHQVALREIPTARVYLHNFSES